MSTDILADPAAQMAFSGMFGVAVGVAVGFFIKKILKFLLFFAGLAFAGLFLLASRGYIDPHWGQIQNDTQAAMQTIVAGMDGGVNPIIAMIGLPMVGGLAVGFGIGIAKG